MRHGKTVILALLANAASVPALAQETEPPPVEHEPDGEPGEDDSHIVVTGQRLPGAVIGDIPPEIQLDAQDIAALGAANIAEVLEALGPQTGSGRGRGGGRPVLLINGRRISGFSEIRDLPAEAIVRVDILPEEAALKYGYRADQRVVNFVLRERFRAITAELEGGFATAGGRPSHGADVNVLRITDDGRWSLDAEYEHAAPLFESERGIVDSGPFRTLLPETDRISLNGTLNRTVFGDVAATFNARLEGSGSRSFLGLPESGAGVPLTRETDGWTGHLGVAFNGDLAPWRWSLTGNYDHGENETLTETGGPLDRAETVSDVADAELVANGALFSLPAGDVSTTFRAGADYRALESETVRSGTVLERELSRSRAAAFANIDLPIAGRGEGVLDEIGDLSVNGNAEVEWLSDFGMLRTIGYGLNWSPVEDIRIIASVTDEDGAPTMQQLGDPVLLTPNVRVFDFLRGETIGIERLSGGSPGLIADNRRVVKLGLTIRPSEDPDLTLRADYTASRTLDPIAAFPAATPEIEAAFPGRFVRDEDGRLARIDARPVNFARAERKELRWGFDFSMPLGPEAERRRPGRGGPGGAGPRVRTEGPPDPGGGRGFGPFGGGRGGRLQLALFHSWRFKDEILIREGVPALDLLGGSAVGGRGGEPRHRVELRAGVFKDGFGARLGADWQSGTFVRGGPDGLGGTAGDLFFDDFTTMDLRLFANLGQRTSLVRKHPWLRGARVSLRIDNLLDSRLDVRDPAGATPLGYQPDLLDPLGRTVSIEFRKLFF